MLVERAVVHRVPKKESRATAEQQKPLLLSETLSPLPDALRQYVQTRLLGSLQSTDKAFDVVFDSGATTPMPDRIRSFLTTAAAGTRTTDQEDQALVDLSREMAALLFHVQPPQPPTGLFTVCAGTIRSRIFVAAMKLEHEKGVTVDERVIHGKRTFEMTVEDELVLTAGTKVFKAAVVAIDPDRVSEPELPYEARISDTQNPFTTAGVATYFTSGFLGVRLQAEPRVVTEQVFEAIQAVINTEITDPASRVAAERALLVEMSAKTPTFNTNTFAKKHLETLQSHALRSRLRELELPVGSFVRDTQLIESRLKVMALDLDGGITVTAPQARFDDGTITVDRATNDDSAVVTIAAGLRRTRARARG